MTEMLAPGPKGGLPPWKEGQKIDLKIMHWCIFGPRRSGMYETTRELIAAENQIEGVLAGMCETGSEEKPSKNYLARIARGGKIDGMHVELITQDWGWAMKWADIHMIHSTYITKVGQLEPKVVLMHGTPEACLASNLRQGDTRKSFVSAIEWIGNFQGTFVTSNRAKEYWGPFDHTGEKIHLVKKGIDLDWWCRGKARQKLEGEPSVLYGEVWRGIKHPYHLIFAVNEAFKRNPELRFNAWAVAQRRGFWEDFFSHSGFNKFLGGGRIRGIVDYPSHYYTRGDLLVSPGLYGDLSRVAQEAMACGCPVLSWDSDPYDDCHAYRYAKAFDIHNLADKIEEVYGEVLDDQEGVISHCRAVAEKYFDIREEAQQIVEVLRRIMSEYK